MGGGGEPDPLILRVWTEAPDDLRLLTADRTARVLAAAVGDWLKARRLVPTYLPQSAAHPSGTSAAA